MGESKITISDARGVYHSVFIRDEKAGDEGVAREVIEGDCYELATLKHAHGFTPETVLDIGSHIGSFPLLVRSLWQSAEIVCVEPNPRSVELLKLNTSGITCLNAAIHYGDGAFKYVDSTDATGGGFVVPLERLAFLQRTGGLGNYSVSDFDVQAVTLEEINEHCELGIIDLLKLDCEGAEVDLFENASRDALSRVRVVVGEFHLKVDELVPLAKSKFPNHSIFIRETAPKIGFFRLMPYD